MELPASQDIISTTPTNLASNVIPLALTVLIVPLAAHALATQHGITVVLHPNATALLDLTAICQNNLIA